MAKKDWRDSGAGTEPTRSKSSDRTGWTNSGGSNGTGWFGKAVFMLAAAGLLGYLIKLYIQWIPPVEQTPIVFFESFRDSQTPQFFSTNAFAKEVHDLIGKSNPDLLQPEDQTILQGNLRGVSRVEINANKSNVVLFYVYADLFADASGQPILLSDRSAIETSANYPLRDFLVDVCEKDLGRGPTDSKNQRIVVLDCGRLDPTAFSDVPPEAIADSVRKTINALRDSQVRNADRLWVLLATDDYQLGWTSPELNGSVFGYFFSRGLMGEADKDDDQAITLAELSTYVRHSVARWVRDYRDASQTPLLLPGDLQQADRIQLVHHHSRQPATISGFENQQPLDHELWKQAYALPQPHRRQVVCSQLIRLEQLRFCQSGEYRHLLDNIRRRLNLDDSEPDLSLDPKKATSIFRFLSNPELEAAISAGAISEFKEFLKPAKEPAARSESAVADDKPEKPGDSAAAPQTADNQADESSPAKSATPKLGRRLQALNGLQRLALVWHYLNHQRLESESFDQPLLKQTLAFIRSDNLACDDFIEMQMLALLENSLPWQKPGFESSVFHSAIRCFDASQSLILGNPGSYSESPGISPDPYATWINWRHVNADFQQIELARRAALDQAIAGSGPSVANDFAGLLQQYNQLSQTLAGISRARKTAGDLLFVLPYLKSFVLRDAVFRNPQADASFCISLQEISNLHETARELVRLVTGPSFSPDQLQRFQTLENTASGLSLSIRERLVAIADDLATSGQASEWASKYVFQAQNLLLTPIPEWLDDQDATRTTSTRKAVFDQLTASLKGQQSTYFNSAGRDDQTFEDLDQRSAEFQKAATARLSEFRKFPWGLAPAVSLTKHDTNQSWNDIQLSVSVDNLTGIDQLKMPSPDQGFLKFGDDSMLATELSRLDATEGMIRLSNRSAGLASRLSDVYLQHQSLGLFDAQLRLANRALRDFWGGGDVYQYRDTSTNPPPFIRQIQMHQQNLDSIAESMQEYKLNDDRYRAYDHASLTALGAKTVAEGEKTWETFRRYQPVWQLDGNTVSADENPIKIDRPNETNRLNLILQPASAGSTENKDLPEFLKTQDELAVGLRIDLLDQWYFGELTVPVSLTLTDVLGNVCFRGHQFTDVRQIARKVVVPPQEKTFTFRPPFLPKRKSTIAIATVKKEVDLIFLLDCSRSMRQASNDPSAREDVKRAVKNVMETLVNEERFHFGLAAFAHRGAYTFVPNPNDPAGAMIYDPDPETNKFRWTSEPGGHHPFDDWEILARPSQKVTDPLQVDALNAQLDNLKAKGLTPLYHSIRQTLQEFDNHPGREQVLIVVTDGVDTQPNSTAAIPEGKKRTILSDLANEYNTRFATKVEVVVLQIDPQGKNPQMPQQFEVIRLGKDTQQELQDRIFAKVGRYRFSVTKKGTSVTEADKRPMNQSIDVNVEPNSVYTIQTHDVPKPAEYDLNLVGGESYNFVLDDRGLRLDSSQTISAIERFVSRVDVPLGTRTYVIGLFQQMNQDNNLRVGFASTRGVGRYPDRIWARITARCTDGQTREFDMTRPAREFSGVPAFAFRMPTGLSAKTVDMTLFLKSASEETGLPDGLQGDSSPESKILPDQQGAFQGLQYKIDQNDALPNQFDVTVTLPAESTTRAFHVECLNSDADLGSALTGRSVTFQGAARVKEKFQFKIRENEFPQFELFAEPQVRFNEAIGGLPTDQNFRTGVDPIFGDSVIVIQFSNIELRN